MAEIKLSNGLLCIVDDEDLPTVEKFIWHAVAGRNTIYAQAWNPYPVGLLMHRLLVNGFQQVHHENGNGLDNRRSNLKGTNSSKHKSLYHRTGTGVHYETSRKKWKARFRCDGEEIFVGRFNTKEEAQMAHDIEWAKRFGDEYGETASKAN